MPRLYSFTVVLSAFLILFPQAYGQVPLGEAGVIPRSNEHKPWPDFDAHGNGFSNFDLACSTNGGIIAHLFGHDGQTPCGPRIARMVVGYPEETTSIGGLYVDGEFGSFSGIGFPDRVGDAAKSQPEGTGGFGSEVAGDAVNYNDYVFSMTGKQMADLLTFSKLKTG